MPVSASSTTVNLANRMDEKPASRNRNLPDVGDAQGSVSESAAGLILVGLLCLNIRRHIACRRIGWGMDSARGTNLGRHCVDRLLAP